MASAIGAEFRPAPVAAWLGTVLIGLAVSAGAAPKTPASKGSAKAAAAAQSVAATPPATAVLPEWAPDSTAAKAAGDPQAFVQGLYARLTEATQATPDVAALHARIAADLRGLVDWGEMAHGTLGARWPETTAPQRAEFTDLLTKMMTNTYVKRFQPGRPVSVAWLGKPVAAAGKSEVRAVLTVGKTSAEVAYFLLARSTPAPGRWWVWDISVDGASQVQTYRTSFKRVLDKEGWPGLMARMKKAADKKTSP